MAAVETIYNPEGMVQLQQLMKRKLIRSETKWDFRDVVDLVLEIVEHIGVLAAPFYFTWGAFRVAVILYLVTLHLGISLSYHRNLSHKSFKLTKPLEYLFAYFGLHAAQGDPMFWVSIHRYHHQFTDSDRDPHSPIEGFWFSHMNWIFHHNYLKEKCGEPNIVMDLEKQVYYRFLRRTHLLHIVGLALLLYVVGGLPHLIWGMGVRIAVGHHSTFMVNSVCHVWGKRPWNTRDLSKNNWLMGLLGHGEGWHNNHHAFEFSARLGLEWWQLDVPWYILQLLAYLGLAKDVKCASKMSAEPVYNPKSVVELQQHTKNDQLVLQKIISDYFRDAVNLGAIIVEHIGLLVAPFYFTWDAFWVFWILAFLTNYLGISLCYHKNLSHKSFKLTKSLEYLFAYFGLHAAQGDPVSWVSTHRYHHQFTDSDRDPHSPIEGFWFSHITWLFQHTHLRKKGGKRNNVVDLEKQAYYRFLRRTYPLHIVGLALVLYIGGGLPHLIWGMGVRTALSHHATFVVNSLCHTWGRKPWNTKDLSKNNSVVGLLGHGEGWHNNHHAFEFSARLGLEWWQLDVPWYIIELLEYLGFATDVKVPTEIQKYRMSCKTYNKFHQNEKDFENPWIRAEP
ncbi:hypothetical protein C5167_037937 [Papaver somniferum]|uniref:Fatty acid desaturase domain-containing protein n=1 Tax=Papaver somniferum TaxID=3469 RepID=A0A4Y7IBV2_PAPSO|nr:hypothetical protein C5167_037937 [Papaver somniferum]